MNSCKRLRVTDPIELGMTTVLRTMTLADVLASDQSGNMIQARSESACLARTNKPLAEIDKPMTDLTC